jgi:hypothetical protein
MIIKVFLRKKILGDILVGYLGNIYGKNLRGITGEISGDISVEYLGSISGKNLKWITQEISGRYF